MVSVECSVAIHSKSNQYGFLTENVATKFPEEDEDDKIVYNRDTCTQLAQHLLHVKNLPVECMKYTDIVQNLKSHEKDMSHPTSWMV